MTENLRSLVEQTCRSDNFDKLSGNLQEIVKRIAMETLAIPDNELSDTAAAVDDLALIDPHARYEEDCHGSLLKRYYTVLTHIANSGMNETERDIKTSLTLRSAIATRTCAVVLGIEMDYFPDYSSPLGIRSEFLEAREICLNTVVLLSPKLCFN